MAADLGPLAGDVAGLLEYRRSTAGMNPAAAPITITKTYPRISSVYVTILPSTDPGRITIPTLAEYVAADLDHNQSRRDIISAALTGFGILLALVAYSALLLAITKGSTW